MGTSPMEALLLGYPLSGDSNGPCSAPSASKLEECECEDLKVDQYYAGVQPRDPSYSR